MSDSDEYLPSANSMESCDTSLSSSRGEMEVPSTVQPYEGEPRASNEDFDEDLQRRFLARGVQVKIRTKKIPLTECLVFYVCVLVSVAKSMLRMSSCVRFCCHNISFLRTICGEGSPVISDL